MPRLILYCEGFIEATWLTALISVPLFFSVLGERIQNEKNYLLRSLAVAALAGWAIKGVCHCCLRTSPPESNRFDLKSLLKTPLAIPALLLTLAVVLSTLASLSPWESFWGTTARRDGSFTYLSCFLFFVVMATGIRTPAQVDRIIVAIILTSVPICLYGIGQRFSVDPMLSHGATDFQFRVASTFANPAFLAAYLIMILPLTISRTLGRYFAHRHADQIDRALWIPAIAYALIALLQLFTILLTVGRGATLGLLCGGAVQLLVFSIHARKRWLAAAIVGIAIVLLGGLVLLASAGGPLKRLAKTPTVERFVQMLDPKAGSSGRSSIWNVAAQAATFTRVVKDCDGKSDALHSLRRLFGYGPEQVGTACLLYRSPEYNAEWLDLPYFDRVHNDFWDVLLTTGMIGLAAYLSLTFMIVFNACKWLGLVNTTKLKTAFWCFLIFGSAGGSLGLLAWQGSGFLGAGLRLGAVFGLAGYLIWVSWLKLADVSAERLPDNSTLLLAALLAGFVAHSVEIALSFPVESTQLYFWTYAALLLLVGHRLRLGNSTQGAGASMSPNVASPTEGAVSTVSGGSGTKTKPNSRSRKSGGANASWQTWRSWNMELRGAVLLALVLSHVGSMLILTYPTGGNSALNLLVNAFTDLPLKDKAPAWALPLALLTTWILSAGLWRNEFARDPSDRSGRKSLAVILAVSGGIALAYWLVLARHRTQMIAISGDRLDLLERYLGGYVSTVDLHYGFTLLLILCWAALWPERTAGGPAQRLPLSRYAFGVATVLALGAILVVSMSTMRWSKAGFMMNRAETFRSKGEWLLMSATAEVAMKSVPAADNLHIILSTALRKRAARAKLSSERDQLLKEADQVLEMGGQIRPFVMEFRCYRGDLYSDWAEAESEPDKRALLAAEAIRFYQQAAILDPGNFDLFNRMAYVELAVRKAPAEAQRWLERALELCPTSHKTHGMLGDTSFHQGLGLAETNRLRTIFFQTAATHFRQALQLNLTNGIEGYRYALALGKSSVQLRDLPQALGAYQVVRRLCPPAERWIQEERLARLYAEMHDRTNALAHVRQALELAPAEQRASLISLREQISNLR